MYFYEELNKQICPYSRCGGI